MDEINLRSGKTKLFSEGNAKGSIQKPTMNKVLDGCQCSFAIPKVFLCCQHVNAVAKVFWVIGRWPEYVEPGVQL